MADPKDIKEVIEKVRQHLAMLEKGEGPGLVVPVDAPGIATSRVFVLNVQLPVAAEMAMTSAIFFAHILKEQMDETQIPERTTIH